MTVFLRIVDADDKPTALRASIRDRTLAHRVFDVDPRGFAGVPRSPFAYWVSGGIRQLFRLESFEAPERTAKQGLATANDVRFIRVWWETSTAGGRDAAGWVPLVKGGAPDAFFVSPPTTVNWANDGRELKAFASAYRSARGWGDQWSAMINSTDFYFKPGFTWPLRASRFAPSVMPAGCAFSTRGCAAFAPEGQLEWLIALASSRPFDYLFKMLLGRFGHPEFTSGALQEMPIPSVSKAQELGMRSGFRRAWSLRRSADEAVEVSHAFVVPAVLQVDGNSLSNRVSEWIDRVAGVKMEFDRVQSEIDEMCFELYGISGADRRAIVEGVGAEDHDDEAQEDDDTDLDADGWAVERSPVGLAAGLVSWAAGIAVGRFDVRLATGERPWPPEPDPFDPLPVCSPAMLTGGDGSPCQSPPVGYPLLVSAVLVDDPGHALDLGARVREVFDVVFGDDADRWWTEVGAALAG